MAVERLGRGIRSVVRPTRGLVPGLVSDLIRSRTELLVESALLRQQLIVAQRHVKRPMLRGRDRAIMVVLAALTRTWRDALLLVKPETSLRWHRAGLRLFWRRKSRTTRTSRRLASATIALIERMALDNLLWGAERIRGELLKLGIRVSKRTIQKYMRLARGPRPWGQSWATFLKNHASQIWACDSLQTYDLFFRPIFAFFIVELGSREVVHVAVTRAPTSRWLHDKFCRTEADSPSCTDYEIPAPDVVLDLQWRTSTELKNNYFWPQNYITGGPAGNVWYDDMVLATERIGCICPS